MRVEKRFYTEESKLLQRAERKAEQESADQQTEAQITSKAQAIMNKVQDEQKKNYRVIPGERLDYFEKISRSAMELAEMAPLDIVVETEQTFGRISLCADCLMLLPNSPAESKEIFSTLVREAESTEIVVGEKGLITFIFVFPFTTEIPRTNQA
ncbi:MAG: hypothetical protein LIP10_15245 [Clostridiales bacterium]|nr:hypothetical protein [Clostridiales bacterium]